MDSSSTSCTSSGSLTSASGLGVATPRGWEPFPPVHPASIGPCPSLGHVPRLGWPLASAPWASAKQTRLRMTPLLHTHGIFALGWKWMLPLPREVPTQITHHRAKSPNRAFSGPILSFVAGQPFHPTQCMFMIAVDTFGDLESE